jgi:hypothetical protein
VKPGLRTVLTIARCTDDRFTAVTDGDAFALFVEGRQVAETTSREALIATLRLFIPPSLRGEAEPAVRRR